MPARALIPHCACSRLEIPAEEQQQTFFGVLQKTTLSLTTKLLRITVVGVRSLQAERFQIIFTLKINTN